MNESGARIDVPPERLFPRRTYLIVATHHAAFEAEQIWRNGRQAGLKFHRSLDLANGTEAPQFVKKIYLELCPRESSGL